MYCGYQGANSLLRVFTPKKKTATCQLDADNLWRNNKIEEDCVIVENFFGRMKMLWGQMSCCYRQLNTMYNYFAMFCVALTNAYIELFPLRADDRNTERRYLTKFFKSTALQRRGNASSRKLAKREQCYVTGSDVEPRTT